MKDFKGTALHTLEIAVVLVAAYIIQQVFGLTEVATGLVTLVGVVAAKWLRSEDGPVNYPDFVNQ